MMCLARTAHPHLYWWCALLVLHILICTGGVPCSYCTSSFVLVVCLTCTAHPHLYWWCALLVLHILICTDDVPCSYCTSSFVLVVCLTCTAHPHLYWWCALLVLHPHLYWWCALLVLHILICTDDLPCSYCTSSFVLVVCLTCTAHLHLY